jgi:hypothetical protein
MRFGIGAKTAMLALLISQPSLGTPPLPDSSTHLQTAEYELATLEELTSEVRNPHLRHRLRTHARNARHAVNQAKTDSMYGYGYGRGSRRGYRSGDRHGYRSGDRYDGGQGYRQYADSRRGPSYGYSGLSYEDAREILSREDFDSGRLAAIERIARKGRFTTEEARALVEMCAFESTKQSALVALYPAVMDPGRYELALAALDFTSSRRAVAEALGI